MKIANLFISLAFVTSSVVAKKHGCQTCPVIGDTVCRRRLRVWVEKCLWSQNEKRNCWTEFDDYGGRGCE